MPTGGNNIKTQFIMNGTLAVHHLTKYCIVQCWYQILWISRFGNVSKLEIQAPVVREEYVYDLEKPGPKVIKLFSCSTQLNMKF